jgi:hypothetical protein
MIHITGEKVRKTNIEHISSSPSQTTPQIEKERDEVKEGKSSTRTSSTNSSPKSTPPDSRPTTT